MCPYCEITDKLFTIRKDVDASDSWTGSAKQYEADQYNVRNLDVLLFAYEP